METQPHVSNLEVSKKRQRLAVGLMALVGLATSASSYAAVLPPKCYIFVHGRSDNTDTFSSYSSAKGYWAGKEMTGLGFANPLGGSGDAVKLIAQSRGFPFYVIGYNATLNYWDSAAQVAVQLANAMRLPGTTYTSKNAVMGVGGYPFSGGLDGGGNGCPAGSQYIVVAHSMGGPVMDFILGNSNSKSSPNYNYKLAPFSLVVPLISSVHVLAGAHRGSPAADAIEGAAGWIKQKISTIITKHTDSTVWLQTDGSHQVSAYMGNPIKTSYVYSARNKMASSLLFPGYLGGSSDDDGVIMEGSSEACAVKGAIEKNAGSSFISYMKAGRSSGCDNNDKMKQVGYVNMTSADKENHSDIRNASVINTRTVLPMGKRCSSRICKTTFLGFTLSQYQCSSTAEEVACAGF